MKRDRQKPKGKALVGKTIGYTFLILFALAVVVFVLALNSPDPKPSGDAAPREEQAQEQVEQVEEAQDEGEQEAPEEPASPDGELVYDGATMRVYYKETKDLASMGLDGMLQADFVVENLSDQECMIGPVAGECVCDGYNVTMTGGTLNVSPGNKAACPLQLNYAAQTGATSFDQIATLSVRIQQTGDDILNPIDVATIDLQL